MAFAFDALACAKRLRESGVSQDQAEAHAEAVRDYVIQEVATKADLQTAAGSLGAEIHTTADSLRTEMRATADTLREELRSEIRTAVVQLETRLTLRGMMAAAVGILAATMTLT